VKITETNLRKFSEWLVRRGRVPGTAETYVSNLRLCGSDPVGLTNRLVDGRLSPNSLRTNLAALRAWALFAGEHDLAKDLADIRLPPARRIHAKVPLDIGQLQRVVHHLQTCRTVTSSNPNADAAVRHVLVIMAVRGLRSGDVLRLRRTEVKRAVETGKLEFEGKGRKRMEFAAESFRAQLEALLEIPGWDRVRDIIAKSSNPKVASVKIWRAARRTAGRVGIANMSPHRYRHTIATRFLDKLSGDPNAIIKLKQYMGWESVNTAAKYVGEISQSQLDQLGAELAKGILSGE